MTYTVRELRKARADKRHILEWLHKRSPAGAAAWLAAYDRMLAGLQTHAHTFGEAHENAELEIDLKEALFKTRRGRVYRALFTIEAEEVFILRVRGPGQAPVDVEDTEG